MFAIFIFSTGIVHAQFSFRPHSHHAPFKHKRHHRQTNSEPAKKIRPEAPAKGPLQIIVSIADQRVSLFDNGVLIARSPVSTGTRGHPTPLGVFSVIGKQRWHRSNIYSAAPMPYMQRITWSGIALHAGVVPGHPASHGCIRLKEDFTIRLWHLTKRGTRVIIARNDVQPVEVALPHLFKPKAASDLKESRAATVPADSINTVSVTHGFFTSRTEMQPATDPQVADSARAGVAPQKVAPISVFVRRKLSKLFVRQGFKPLLDVVIKIQNPEVPLGYSKNQEAIFQWPAWADMCRHYVATRFGHGSKRDPKCSVRKNARSWVVELEL